MFFLQMAGFPGSGKSTLARVIAKSTGAVVIDHDVVKSALLQSIDSPIHPNDAGKIAYNIDWSLIDFHLSQGHSVIFDSPCLYEQMLEKGTALAEKYRAKYKYVECYLNDFDEINARLQQRVRMPSQIERAASLEFFKVWVDNSKRPIDGNFLIVDSSQPLEIYMSEVIQYVNS